MASGIKHGMIIALKIKADSTALDEEVSFMMLRMLICGIELIKIAGMIAKYFADVICY